MKNGIRKRLKIYLIVLIVDNIMEIECLIDVLDNSETSEALKEFILALINSVRDWPDSLNTIEEFNLQVESFILNKVTKKNIEEKISKIDLLKNAWYVESLTQLIEVFDLFEKQFTLPKEKEQEYSFSNIIFALGKEINCY